MMKYGEGGEGATGYLVGEENKGLAAMFIMMNEARLAVGIQGVAVAERATQRANDYARERRQGRAMGTPAGSMSPIIEHPDVRRNLMMMRSSTLAARGICLATAAAVDVSQRAADAATRAAASHRVALLTPVAKAWPTDIGVEMSSIGVQIHGGMGFIEETGAAQHFRDSRILPIYEGTNGIQAIDLAVRKLPMEGGQVVRAFIAELRETAVAAQQVNAPAFGRMGDKLLEAVEALDRATGWMLARHAGGKAGDQEAILASAAPYLTLFGITSGGCFLARNALAAHRAGVDKAEDPIAMARFFAKNVAVAASATASVVMDGADSLLAVAGDRLMA
jgi:hypothetical protein